MKNRILGMVSAAMIVCFMTGCPVTPPPVSPHEIGFGGGLYLLRAFHDSKRTDKIVELADNAGMRWSREEFHWEWIEPEQNRQDSDTLSRYDRSVALLRSHDISILGLLAYDTPWSAGENAPSTDTHRDDYARFAASMTTRYRDSVHYWEVWNEPNLDHFWQPKADPLAYTELLRTAYAAIKNADPNARVVGCATSGVDIEFIRAVLDAGGGACMDVLSIHPYSGHKSTDADNVRGDIRELRAILDERSLNLPLWVSEFGFQTSTNENGVSEAEQGGMLVRSYLTLFAEGVDVAINYDFVDDGTHPEEGEENFGVLHRDLSPKPAYTAVANTASLLSGAQCQRSMDLAPYVETFVFSLPDNKQVWTIWTRKPDGPLGLGILGVPEVDLPISGTIEQITDLDGNALALPVPGATRLTPTQDPIFVTVQP